MARKILEKFVKCDGCNKKYTVNYKSEQNSVKTTCTYCGKENTHQVKPKNTNNASNKQSIRKRR